MTRISLIAPGRLGLARTISSWNWMIRSWEPLRGVPPGRDGSVGIWIRPSKAGKNQAFDGDRMGYLWICHQQCVFFSPVCLKMEYTPPNGPFQKVRYYINYIFKKMRFPPLKPPKMDHREARPNIWDGPQDALCRWPRDCPSKMAGKNSPFSWWFPQSVFDDTTFLWNIHKYPIYLQPHIIFVLVIVGYKYL